MKTHLSQIAEMLNKDKLNIFLFLTPTELTSSGKIVTNRFILIRSEDGVTGHSFIHPFIHSRVHLPHLISTSLLASLHHRLFYSGRISQL